MLIAGLARHTGLRLAEVAYLLIAIAGVWLAASQLPQVKQLKWKTVRTVVAGVALGAAGVLLIVATHWGHYGTV